MKKQKHTPEPVAKSKGCPKSKPGKVLFVCPDKTCDKYFKTERALAAHFGRSPSCANVFAKQIKNEACLMVAEQQSKAMLPGGHLDATELSVTSIHSESSSNVACNVSTESELDSDDNVLPANVNNGTEESNIEAQQPSEYESINPQCFSDSLYYQTKLLKLLHDANAPHFLFQEIIEWVQEMHESRVPVELLTKTRSSLIHQLENWMPHMQRCKPHQVDVLLPTANNPQRVQITVFDFKTQLLSLLNDKFLFENISNLDINPNDPFGKYRAPNRILRTINSGHRYQLAYQNLIKDEKKEFLLPIIFACDETKVSSQGKTSCWPLLFTTTILNKKSRNLPIAWRPLGYIYDTSLLLSQNEEKRMGVPLKYKRLHKILDTILASYVACQNDDSLHHTTLHLGCESKMVNLKVPCFFIIGDMQGGDKMCCSAPVYMDKLNRLCRKCNVKGSESGDPFVQCQKIVSNRIRHLVESRNRVELQKLNQYCVKNAWFKVDFGGCPYGIFSAACPVEPLHSLENGIIADCLKILYKKLSCEDLAQLDVLARRLTLLPRQRYSSSGSDKSMPRLLWKDGITTLTDLPASSKVGIMFTIVVISLTSEGKEYFTRVLGQVRVMNDMRECFQMLLCYWVWLKQDSFWNRKDKSEMNRATDAIRQMLSRVISLWPRETGQGWNLAKFHEQIHIPDDIYYNGSPRGSHSGPVEHNHIQMVKRPSQRTQKRRTTLDNQLARRLYENVLVNAAIEHMTSSQSIARPTTEAPKLSHGITKNSSKVTLKVTKKDGNCSAYYKSGGLRVGFHVLKYLSEIYCDELAQGLSTGNTEQITVIDLFSEFYKGDKIYRAHSNYRKNGAWHDWAMIRWTATENIDWPQELANECHVHFQDEDEYKRDYYYAPAKILCFTNPSEDVYHAVVECCEFQFSRDSIFSTRWKKAYIYEAANRRVPYLLHVDAKFLVRHCLMIPDFNGDVQFYHEIWDRSLWAGEFL